MHVMKFKVYIWILDVVLFDFIVEGKPLMMKAVIICYL